MRKLFFILFAGILVLRLVAQEKTQPAQQTEEEQGMNIAALSMFLKPTSSVLRVGTMEVTWQELQPWFKQLQTKAQQNPQGASAEDMRQALRAHLVQLATRGLFLQEAKAMKLVVTEEDRKNYEAELDLRLKMRKQNKSEYMRSFSPTVSTLSRLTFDDTLLLIKLDKTKFANLELTEKEKEIARYYLSSINENVEQQNDLRREQVAELRKDPEITTAEGFAKLAKTYSEGVEGDNGGELDYDFTRQELADNLDLKTFDWKVGETTPLLETDSCYRIIRVLRDVPPAKEGEPPRLRVAQILFAKLATEPTTDDYLRRKFLPNKKQAVLSDYAQELSRKYPVSSVFFPNGLFEKPQGDDAKPAVISIPDKK
jgi:hypothetical protein